MLFHWLTWFELLICSYGFMNVWLHFIAFKACQKDKRDCFVVTLCVLQALKFKNSYNNTWLVGVWWLTCHLNCLNLVMTFLNKTERRIQKAKWNHNKQRHKLPLSLSLSDDKRDKTCKPTWLCVKCVFSVQEKKKIMTMTLSKCKRLGDNFHSFIQIFFAPLPHYTIARFPTKLATWKTRIL